MLEVLALLLEEVQGVLPRFGIFYGGADRKATKVHFSSGLKASTQCGGRW